ncbi:Uncharacterized protein Adt_21396 [Abeliophyllum distichum]|uniref:Uncharacterized protein n=2 Tax=Forsythieae TaxID=426104 RepID=A0ABD1SZD8_9LAMI
MYEKCRIIIRRRRSDPSSSEFALPAREEDDQLGGIENSNFRDARELIDPRIRNASAEKGKAQFPLQTKVDPKENLAQSQHEPHPINLLSESCTKKRRAVEEG